MTIFQTKHAKFLNSLRECYKVYSQHWEDWLLYKGEKYLTQEELYALEIYIKNNFILPPNELVMFYYKPETIEKILLHLEKTMIEFKEWILDHWFFSLLKIESEDDSMKYIEKPINGLKICNELIVVLEKFEKKNLAEIFDSYSDTMFMEDFHFSIVLKYMSVLRKHEKDFKHSFKREVTTINWN